MISVSVDRSALGLPPLVFADPASGMWVESVGRPGKRKRRRYAAESQFIDGNTIISSTTEQSSLPLTLYIEATSQANLDLKMDEVEAAFDQLAYPTTVDVSGSLRVWPCDPADVDWGDIDEGMTQAVMVKGSVVIPVFPRSS